METSKSNKIGIDYKKLEAELQKEIHEDELYWLRNEAKLRSVSQGTSTYEEFRQIVLAAHLKPLTKKDKDELEQSTTKGQVIWNNYGSPGTSAVSPPHHDQDENVRKQGTLLPMPQIPSYIAEFCKSWKSFGQDNYEMKWIYLQVILKATQTESETEPITNLESKSYEQNMLRRLWFEEVPSEIFPDLIQCLLHITVYTVFPSDMIFHHVNNFPPTLNDHIKLEDWKNVLQILYIASLSKRHKISKSFLSEDDKNNLERIFEKLQRRVNQELQSVEEIEGEAKLLLDLFTSCSSAFMKT